LRRPAPSSLPTFTPFSRNTMPTTVLPTVEEPEKPVLGKAQDLQNALAGYIKDKRFEPVKNGVQRCNDPNLFDAVSPMLEELGLDPKARERMNFLPIIC